MSQNLKAIVAKRRREDFIFKLVGTAATLLGVVTLTALFGQLCYDGLSRIDWSFLSSYPGGNAQEAGILPGWVGSLMVMFVTAATAVPTGIAAGVFLEEYGSKNWRTTLIELNISNLAGVPSIIYGLMGLAFCSYLLSFSRRWGGDWSLEGTVLAGGVTLGALILPIVIVATREALRSIPQEIREAAYGMGATRWQVVRYHLLPYSTGGIATGVIIGLSRAIGETAPLIAIGTATYLTFLPAESFGEFISLRWLGEQFTVLPIQMFDLVSRPGKAFHANAAAAGLLLIAVTLSMNAVAIAVRYRMRKRIKW
jgi:phosphate transport system permease protein